MQDEQLRYPFEEKFKEDLATYLQEKELVDEILPDTTDMEGKWLGIAEAYLPDGMREFAAYPIVSLGWMMYIGMAIAKYWDEDWELYNKVGNLYTYLRDRITTTWMIISVRKYFSLRLTSIKKSLILLLNALLVPIVCSVIFL